MKQLIKQLLRESLLNEGISDVMYHFTDINKVKNILISNQILLSQAFATQANNLTNKLYFLSLSTTKNSNVGYGKSLGKNDLVRLTMNGRALNHNYISKAVDYWGTSRNPQDHPHERMNKMIRFDEHEERIITDKDRITPANRYIISVEVLNGDQEKLGIIKKLCDDLKIPFYAYVDDNYFNASLKAKAIQIEPSVNTTNDNEKESNYIDYTISKIVAYLGFKDSKLKEKVLNGLSKFNIDIDNISAKAENYLKENIIPNLRYFDNFRISDASAGLEANIHNENQSRNDAVRYIIRELGLDMKRNNVMTIKAYLEYKVYKGKKLQKDYNKEFSQSITRVIDETYNEALRSVGEYRYSGEFNGEYYDNIFDAPPIKNLLDSKINQLKKYCNNYILNNNDMFKYSYVLGSDYIKEELKVNNRDFTKAFVGIDSYDRVDANSLFELFKGVIYDVSQFAYDEAKRLQEEYNQQFRD